MKETNQVFFHKHFHPFSAMPVLFLLAYLQFSLEMNDNRIDIDIQVS